MNLRRTLLTLSLLAVLSASLGGYFYYQALQKVAFQEGERQAALRLESTRRNISSLLYENIKPARTLAGMPEILAAAQNPTLEALAKANLLLDHFQQSLHADVCYLMDTTGLTLAASNRHSPDSFVGKNFGFRPYFQKAMQMEPASYLALGTTSEKRGAYSSQPISIFGRETPFGVVVIKTSIERIESELILNNDEIILVTSPQGVIFISNRPDWLYKLLTDLPESKKNLLTRSRQFGPGPWQWSGLRRQDPQHLIDNNGSLYLTHKAELNNYPGWIVHHLKDNRTLTPILSNSLIRITGPTILILCVLLGSTVLILYSRASSEIIKRKNAQAALRTSERRYRSLYNKTPAMLHSIDKDGLLLSVSDHWLQVLGYQKNEVIGNKLTDYYTEASRKHAEEIVIPEFFRTGVCYDVPYQFVKHNGELIDVLLSAIGEKDQDGRIIRSLAVSIDVTERKRAEEALQLAKEELSRYSQDLERKVEMRSREIHSILTNTPDVVYMRDIEGNFTLINKKFAALFQTTHEAIGSQEIREKLLQEFSEHFFKNDMLVMQLNESIQVEEQLPLKDGIHTYLSVKFPIYDDNGAATGLCSISTDVTELNKAQAQLRRLSASIIENQENERKAIARELHDELGQVLTALRMEAASLQDRLCLDDKIGAERANKMCELIDTTIDEVRRMAIRLRPGVLDDLGLVDALEWYTSDFEQRAGISCFFDHNAIPEIPPPIATAAYRITQEALTNAARHSQTSSVAVQLFYQDTTLQLTIEDQGKGLNSDTLPDSEGLGIAGMRERAVLAGGTLTVASQAGKGVTVSFNVHL